ncbi:MAG: helix-turn-helix transcriptional regulator [Dehalococcoidia bacterium]
MSTLRELRDKMFLTQEELAEMVGVNMLAVSRWEHGKQRPRAKTIRKLAKALKVNPKDIEF